MPTRDWQQIADWQRGIADHGAASDDSASLRRIRAATRIALSDVATPRTSDFAVQRYGFQRALQRDIAVYRRQNNGQIPDDRAFHKIANGLRRTYLRADEENPGSSNASLGDDFPAPEGADRARQNFRYIVDGPEIILPIGNTKQAGTLGRFQQGQPGEYGVGLDPDGSGRLGYWIQDQDGTAQFEFLDSPAARERQAAEIAAHLSRSLPIDEASLRSAENGIATSGLEPGTAATAHRTEVSTHPGEPEGGDIPATSAGPFESVETSEASGRFRLARGTPAPSRDLPPDSLFDHPRSVSPTDPGESEAIVGRVLPRLLPLGRIFGALGGLVSSSPTGSRIDVPLNGTTFRLTQQSETASRDFSIESDSGEHVGFASATTLPHVFALRAPVPGLGSSNAIVIRTPRGTDDTKVGFGVSIRSPREAEIYNEGIAAGWDADKINAAISLERANPEEVESDFKIGDMRYTAGKAFVGGEPLADAGSDWLLAGHGRIPGQVATRMAGRRFYSFDDFRKAFWRAVADTPEIAAGFSKQNQRRMRRGQSPFAQRTKWHGKHRNFIIHHDDEIRNGGSVYDMSNMTVFSPKFHNEIHYGEKNER